MGRYVDAVVSLAWSIQAPSDRKPEAGAALVEYTLLLLLIVVAALAAMKFVGVSLAASLGHSSNTIGKAVGYGG